MHIFIPSRCLITLLAALLALLPICAGAQETQYSLDWEQLDDAEPDAIEILHLTAVFLPATCASAFPELLPRAVTLIQRLEALQPPEYGWVAFDNPVVSICLLRTLPARRLNQKRCAAYFDALEKRPQEQLFRENDVALAQLLQVKSAADIHAVAANILPCLEE